MFDIKKIASSKTEYRNIYIIEDQNLWELHGGLCEKDTDLILCIDFGLFKFLKDQDYSVAFLDHLAEKEVLELGNAQMNNFLENWFIDNQGSKFLSYKDFNIGDALLLNILNDVTYFYHFFFNIIQIKKISYNDLFVALRDVEVEKILTHSNLKYIKLDVLHAKNEHRVYSFPISKWTEEAISRTSVKTRIVDMVSNLLDLVFAFVDLFKFGNKTTVFVQHYFPTKEIVNRLLSNKKLKVVLTNYVKDEKIATQRRIAYSKHNIGEITTQLLSSFRLSKKQEWYYEDITVSEYLYAKIDPIIENNLQGAINTIESILTYFRKNQLALMVPITNLWLNNRLLMNYCQNNKIPIFMIINGLLNINHWKDGFDSNYVNCYSESIREDYFNNKEGVIALGDPRMDKYALSEHRQINRSCPNITIGAAGFDNIDLNSYLAFEFDFLFDILFALEKYKHRGYLGIITLKVRGNGYVDLYEQFIKKYYPDLVVKIEQNIPFFDVIKNTDLYITFNSQSILEAAALGIPTIYYKKDKQTIFRPYDDASELVTANNVQQLDDSILAFYNNSKIYDKFLNLKILEKYVGPLDGKNLERNLNFINEIINKNS